MSANFYHLDEGIYVRLNCHIDVSSAFRTYIEIKKEDGTTTEVTAEQDPYSSTHIRYLIPASGSPFSTAPTGKDSVEYWLRSKVVFSESYPRGKQGKPVKLTVGKSWSAT